MTERSIEEIRSALACIDVHRKDAYVTSRALVYAAIDELAAARERIAALTEALKDRHMIEALSEAKAKNHTNVYIEKCACWMGSLYSRALAGEALADTVQEECGTCSGRGKVACRACGGGGEHDGDACEACLGSGSRFCPDCTPDQPDPTLVSYLQDHDADTVQEVTK